MKSAWYDDPYTTAAMNDGNEGLYPFMLPTQANMQEEGSPWDWWDAAYWSAIPHPSCPANSFPACNFHTINSINNSTVSAAKARTYIDTIMGYFAPRACAVLDLPCSTVSTEQVLSQDDVKLVVAPNPASDYVRFTSEAGKTILGVYLFDLSGRLVKSENAVNNTQYEMSRSGLPTGLYIAKIKFEDGIMTQKLMFD